MLNKIVENIGLNNKEAAIYLAALELGSSPVSVIAAKAKINRVTTYDVLEKLSKKGLINFIIKAKLKYFNATDPEIVAVNYKKRAKDFEEALPDLKRLGGVTVHPTVRYYEGIEGIKAIYADTLTSQTEILNYANSHEIRIHWPTYDEDYVNKRAAKQIHLRGIAPDDEYGKTVQSHDTQNFREIRLISKDKFNFTNEINIYDNKVAIISFKDELIGMIIESPEIANTQRAIFKMAWEFCELENKLANGLLLSAEEIIANSARKQASIKPLKPEKTEPVTTETKEQDTQVSLF